jgi:NADH:ubiquinone oxidoreductase subunit F (NADH-binding)
MMGSGGFVVMDEDTCMVDVAKYFLQFIQDLNHAASVCPAERELRGCLNN